MLTLVAWILAQQYRLQLVLEFGSKHALSANLLADSYKLLASIVLCTVLTLAYLSPLRALIFAYPALLVLASVLGVCALAIVTLFGLCMYYSQRYYKALSSTALRQKIQQQFQ